MPQISQKGKDLPASPIRKLVPFANRAIQNGKKIYYLNIGQPDIETPAIAFEAVRNCTRKVIEYSPSDGYPSLKKKLVEYHRNVGIDIDLEDILVATGASEAITFAFMATLDEGDEIIIPEPFYANYAAFATMAGAKVRTVTSYINDGYALPPISEFEKLITPKTKGIVLNNPNNPTGCIYSKEELFELARLVKKYDLYLYADEVYRRFCYDGEKLFSVMNIREIEQNTILFDSMSKRFSECGLRIGAIITRNREVMSHVMKFAMARLSPPTFGQIAAEATLSVGEEYFDGVYKEYITRRNYFVNALNDIPGVVCPMPKGAFYCFAKLPVDDANKFARWLLEEFEYKGASLLIAPGDGFYQTPGLGRQEVRFAYVINLEDLKKSIEILRIALEQYPGRED